MLKRFCLRSYEIRSKEVIGECCKIRNYATTHGMSAKQTYGKLWKSGEELKTLTKLESMLRVNQAGEHGAVVISEGQQRILKHDAVIREIYEQEKEHLMVMEGYVKKRRVRPTVLMPIWSFVGYGIGMGSAMMGREVAMVVHEAVEDVITDHYNEQLREIHEMGKGDGNFEKDLRMTIKKCRDEEMHHHDLAVANKSQEAPMYGILYTAVKTGCQTAIWLSEKV